MREHLTTVAPAKPVLSDAAGGVEGPVLSDAAGGVEGPVLSDTAGGVEGARAQADSPPRRRLRLLLRLNRPWRRSALTRPPLP